MRPANERTSVNPSAALRYFAKKEPPPEGVELFVDDGLASWLQMVQREDGSLADVWTFRLVHRPTMHRMTCYVEARWTPRELYDAWMNAISVTPPEGYEAP